MDFPTVDLNISYNQRQVALRIPQSEKILVKEIFEDGEYALLPDRHLPAPSLVWDVGANVGLYAVYMKLKYPACKVHCFEPSPRTLPLLKKNTAPFDGISIHPFGLFNQDKENVTLKFSSVIPAADSIKDLSPSDTSGGSAQIQLKQAGAVFDNLGQERLDVLKLDSEGCEIEILESLGSRLERIDYVLVEYHKEDDRRQIDSLLHDFALFGFRLTFLGIGVMRFVRKALLKNLP